ncbi:hypothetical protein [Rhizobium sp. CECT 9324]|jgi:transcriptional regulator with XRE-family HTH domain|uniref:hypothetical protein n=1 Tax=Rhizobium sp. CECT 9324 TaxID=2845820 RepID=UPI000DDEF4F3|nr:hypothetical protein [Rhizobium sp. CECT 9324]CAH0340297.1 hypothetical protein RHI9324_01955 [Rhizobium sp. CECT 9324]
MISAAQIRAARAFIDLTIDKLSAASGVSALMILQIETERAYDAGPEAYGLLQSALEEMGIAFLEAGQGGEGGEGIRLNRRPHEVDGIRPENLNATNDD